MYKKIYFSLFLSLLVVFGCKKDTQLNIAQTVDPLVQFTANTFNDFYLWYESMPAVDLTTIKTPDEYINKIRYIKDRWSFTMSYTDMINLLENGETTGWGAGMGFDDLDILRILFVYDNSAMGKAGVKRGWQIKAINGKTVAAMSDSEVNTVLNSTSNSFIFIKNDGSESTIQMTKGNIIINSVQYSNIYQKGAKKIGYLVFSDFLGSSVKELNSAFDNFAQQGITDMVLDIRYNGGGTLDCADSLVAMLAGKPYNNKVYNTLTYNNKHVRMGYQSVIGLKPNSVQLNKLIVITTSSTASASELVISGLKPYMNMKLIGSTTHGKPVGMNIEGDTKLNIAVAPISFRNVNSQGYSDYFDGIPVDYNIKDNVTQDWGNLSDACLTAALNYISMGTIGYLPVSKSAIISGRILYKGTDHPVENLYQSGNKTIQ
ncbi:MAG: S41 family peptidase [Bacteroidia bacterium]|nr:S41 family peptidase [Bacteroidia bacterium]